MLPDSARIKSSADFARVTKIGRRATTNSFIGYYLAETKEPTNSSTFNQNPAKLGLIVGKSIGNSVTRHRIARQIRHSVRDDLMALPQNSFLVIRVMKRPENAFYEAKTLISTIKKLANTQATSKYGPPV